MCEIDDQIRAVQEANEREQAAIWQREDELRIIQATGCP